MIVVSDGYRIDFQDAINAFKFDETDQIKSTYHGVTELKAVDVIAELDTAYIFVEMKEFTNLADYESLGVDDDSQSRHEKFVRLKNYLKYKFRDSFLYRFAEDKVDKPIHYICLLNFDNALNSAMERALQIELPTGVKTNRWYREIGNSCHVFDATTWNRNFPKWPLRKI